MKSKSKLQISKTDYVKTDFDIRKNYFDSIYFDFGIAVFFNIDHAWLDNIPCTDEKSRSSNFQVWDLKCQFHFSK